MYARTKRCGVYHLDYIIGTVFLSLTFLVFLISTENIERIRSEDAVPTEKGPVWHDLPPPDHQITFLLVSERLGPRTFVFNMKGVITTFLMLADSEVNDDIGLRQSRILIL